MRMGFVKMTQSKLPCLLLICATLSGCMSIGTLSDDQGVYRGVRGDIDCMRTAQDDTSGMELLCGLDLPFSLALDTIFLPFTLIDTLTGSPDEAR
jgi:uncharacterized protein YceK